MMTTHEVLETGIRETDRRVNIVDTKLPLTWLLSTAGIVTVFLATTLWNVSMQSNKLDQLVVSTTKIESNMSAQDGKMDKLKDSVNQLQRMGDIQQTRIEQLERSNRK
jgi:uncharacterized membrane protein